MIRRLQYAPSVLTAAGVATLLAALQSAVTHEQLATQGVRGPLRLDPLGTATGGLTFVLTVLVYAWLGYRVVRHGGTTARAAVAGAVAGVVAGALGGLLQAYSVRDYLELALTRVYVPPWYLAATLGLVAALLTILGGLVGAVSGWFGGRVGRRGGAPPSP